MSYSFEDYRKEVAPRFEAFLDKNQDKDVNELLSDSFYFIGYLSDKMNEAKKNTEVLNCFHSLVLQTLDLSRSLVSAQSLLLLTQSALAYRTLFEIYCNVLFITRADDSHALAQRFQDFGVYEELSGRESLHFLDNPSDEEINRLLAKYPEWGSKDKVRKLKVPKNWAPENKSLKDIAVVIGLGEQYIVSYKLNSKFSHSSSIITKLYKRQNVLYLAAEAKVLTHNTVPAMMYSVKIMIELCTFFGVEFNLSDYIKLTNKFIVISKKFPGPLI